MVGLTDHTDDLNHGAEVCRVLIPQAFENRLEEERACQLAGPDDCLSAKLSEGRLT